eukprot:CAMPEP_0185730532 /NCGR_PEP_ID=MMETSP1171-20130828/10173_1 /TAXON_ID=374046 /ORGANISM="Helicotheca tamensis, Strain CCMP826" /LENGTH=390 /DNA_ID=CAMNT_0028399603 /DNA_START=119 /DNA_END=1288 /DNA_ORIENTATION=-
MDELAQLTNASATFEDVAENGPPAAPLNFPDPTVGRAARVTATVFNPATGEGATVPNVIFEDKSGQPPSRAYWIGRKLKKAIYGCVRSCTVLKLREGGSNASGEHEGTAWEVTPEMAAVKIMDWNAINELRGRHMEDPVKEVSAMQFISLNGGHPNVMGCKDVLSDNKYLYSFMPFCTCGELFGYVDRDGRFTEPVTRWWFRQLINGLYHLQKMGVCHRDLSLENILVDQYTKSLIIDMGMCLRVPFGGDDDDSITDVSAGTLRRLMTPQGQCGKPNYISPEVLKNTDSFDGFAIDVWAAGIILFIMLVGLPPFEWANREDPRFRMITGGGLMRMLTQWQRPISPEAGDLLQRMLREDPRERLSLVEIMDHAWVVNDDVAEPTPPQEEGW